MRVIYKANGQQYDIPDEKFDAKLWQPVGQAPQTKGEGLSQYAPIVGQILGGIGGGLVGGPVGAVAGAGAGGALGEGIHQKVAGEQTDVGKMLKEGAWGIGGELTGLGIAKLGGKLLSGMAPKLAEKVVGASPTQTAKFLAKTGQNVGDFATAEGLLTRSAEDVAKKLLPVGEAYKTIAGGTGTKLAKKELVNGLLEQASTLEKSIIEADKGRAKQLFDLASNIDTKYGDVLTGPELTTIKQVIAKEGGNQAFDLGTKSIYKGAEDVARGALYKGAGTQTMPLTIGGRELEATLPQIGQQQKALMEFQKIVEKQAGKGKGAELLGLGSLGRMGTGAGGGVGFSIASGEKDPMAIARNALIGAGLSSLASNPKALGTLVKGMAGGGKALTEAATMTAGSKAPALLTLLSQATGQGVKSLVQPQAQEGATQAQQTQQVEAEQGAYKTQPETDQGNISGQQPIISPGGQWRWDQQSNDWVPNKQEQGGLPTGDQIKQAMVQDLITTGGKNITKLETLNKVLAGPSEKPLSSTQINQVNLAKSGLRGLTKAEQILGFRDKSGNVVENPKVDMGILTKQLVPGQLLTRDYDAATFSATESLLRARSGAAVPETEVKRYQRKLFPAWGDSEAVVAQKISELRTIFGDMLNQRGAGNEDALQSILSQQ